jgi:hypothetical protein
MRLSRNNTLSKDILLIDGIGRSGKFYISNLVSSFDRVEISQLNNAFDLIPRLYRIGKIYRDAAIIYLKIEADLGLSENMIGRRINFRKGDSSSIYNYPNPDEYKQRLDMDEGDDVVIRVNKDKPIYQTVTHNAIANARLFFDAFESCKMIYCIRNPIDVVYSWVKKGFGERIGIDPREVQLTQLYNDTTLPIYTYGWEEEYMSINEYERVVKMIWLDSFNDMKGYTELSDKEKENVMFLNIPKFNQDRQKGSYMVADFLGIKTTEYTPQMLDKEVNQSIPMSIDTDYKYNDITKNLSPKYMTLFKELINGYEKDNMAHWIS